MTPEQACKNILVEAMAGRGGVQLRYAAAYAEKYLKGEKNKTQLLYILNNIQYWRGHLATESRKALKQAAGVK